MHNPSHPGAVLRDGVFSDKGMTVTEFAKHLGVTRVALSRVLHAKAAISAESWLHMQANYDLWRARRALRGKVAKIAPVFPRAAHEEHAGSAFEHYTARLAGQPELVALAAAGPNGQTGLTASRRLRAILRHTDTLVSRPAASTASDLAGLTAAGLDEAQIVVLSQIASFVWFQVRIVHGLAILKGTL